MKELSEWQAARVRDALRAYHRYERGIDGEYFTWKDVREAIAVYTDVEIGASAKNGAERLRQFVEGIEDGKGTGKRKFPLPQPAAIEGIVAFVTDEELNLLTMEELQEYRPGFQACLRMLEYLEDDSQKEQDEDASERKRDIGDSFIVESRFIIEGSSNSFYWTRELILHTSKKTGMIQVTDTEERFKEAPKESYFHHEEYLERRKNLKSRELHSGWAIRAPEGNLLFFLKNERNSKNRYLTTMAIDTDTFSNFQYIQLVLLQHESPIKLGMVDEITPAMIRKVPWEVSEKIFTPTLTE